MRRALVSSLLWLGCESASAAFELFPEYRTLSESEAERLADPRAIDPETESDVLAFLPPLSHDRQVFATRGTFDLSLGSLSSKRFLFNQRARFGADLTETLSFLFSHVTQENYEDQRRQNVLELRWKLDPRWSVAAYGEPSGQKEEDDLGLALLFNPEDNHHIRLFHTWTDPTRGERTIAGDRFVNDRTPNAIGFSGRRIRDGSYLHYTIRAERPSRWRFPQFERDFTSRRFFSIVEILQPFSERVSIEGRVQWDEWHAGFEPLSPVAPATAGPAGTRRRRLHALLAADLKPVSSLVSYRTGVYIVDREWRLSRPERTQKAGQRSFLPHIWFSIPSTERLAGRRDRIDLGFEATLYGARGARELLSESSRRSVSVESRANLRYAFVMGRDAALTLLVSADLDRRDGGGLFEGGNGQFVCTF